MEGKRSIMKQEVIDKSTFERQVSKIFSEELGIKAPDKKTIDEVFCILDKDASGTITLVEFSFFISMFNEELHEMKETSFPILDEILGIFELA